MNVVNLMNFVRGIDERKGKTVEGLLGFTAEQLRMANHYHIENTFLLQYDAVCDEGFVSLFKNEATNRTELGLWYEIVEPLTTACGMPYRSKPGWGKWDPHVIPGLSMGYTPEQREQMIDEAMRKFKEVFGYYPRTVASWLIDTHTINYLTERYDISAMAICRDQINTDCCTLKRGYFNQAYYPSKKNMFTPAQSKEMQINVPMFRLLGPCPIHNYDDHKYSSDKFRDTDRTQVCSTLEPGWYIGFTDEATKWMFDCYYSEESLGFAYSQIGQENSFYLCQTVLGGMKMQIEQLLGRGDVEFKKMGDTGELFRSLYPEETPATSVVALNNFDSTDVQSVYYDCKNYTANLFRFEDKIFFRNLSLFDDRVEDIYMNSICTTYRAEYENLPIVDTQLCPVEDRKRCGLMIDTSGASFEVSKISDGVLRVTFGEKSVTFYDDRIEVITDSMLWYNNATVADTEFDSEGIAFEYKDHPYRLNVEGATALKKDEGTEFNAVGNKIILYPRKSNEKV